MLPEILLPYSACEGRVVPHYLTERDHPWLRVLIDEYERYVGRPRRELDARMREPLPCPCPRRKQALAARVLDRSYGGRSAPPVPPVEARAAVFTAAARDEDRRVVLDRVARDLRVAPAALEDALFADLPSERLVVAPNAAVGPAEVALRVNLSLVQGILFRSTRVEIDLTGNARAIVRHAKLRGLICSVLPRPGARSRASIEISGPLSILRRTLLYGRALAELAPILAWCERFQIRAECVLRGETLALVVASGDPILPAAEPRRYDSKIEERFARDFRRIAPCWDVTREPEPVSAAGKLIFPDFLLRHRREAGRCWLLEIVGFWTPDYLSRKLSELSSARIENLILCIDEDRNVAEQELPAGTPVVRFRRRIDAEAVLRVLEHGKLGRPNGSGAVARGAGCWETEMESMKRPVPTPIYRFLHVDNLAVCLQRERLHAPLHVPKDGQIYRTIHNLDLQNQRRVRRIPCGPAGVIHDYVPFYLGPRTPMLLQLHSGRVEGYKDGQEPLIYVVSTAEAVTASGRGFVFSDGHGSAAFTSWFSDLADMDRVDWTAAYARYWKDDIDDMDRQRKKQAEFLVHQMCHWDLIQEVAVLNQATRLRVETILAGFPSKLRRPVNVRPEWYY